MSNEYFYMQFATSFDRIIWNIIAKVVEEAHIVVKLFVCRLSIPRSLWRQMIRDNLFIS
jgi:hypothetical protein